MKENSSNDVVLLLRKVVYRSLSKIVLLHNLHVYDKVEICAKGRNYGDLWL